MDDGYICIVVILIYLNKQYSIISCWIEQVQLQLQLLCEEAYFHRDLTILVDLVFILIGENALAVARIATTARISCIIKGWT